MTVEGRGRERGRTSHAKQSLSTLSFRQRLSQSLTNSHRRSQPHPLVSPFFMAEHDIWNILLVSCPGCAPYQSFSHSQPIHCGSAEWEAEKALMLGKHLWQPKHWCVISTVLATNPRHSTTQAARKKVNSIPAKTSTGFQAIFETASFYWVGE